ncbi:unnamed protein product [Ectocarpus sp. 12 AP-2014]
MVGRRMHNIRRGMYQPSGHFPGLWTPVQMENHACPQPKDDCTSRRNRLHLHVPAVGENGMQGRPRNRIVGGGGAGVPEVSELASYRRHVLYYYSRCVVVGKYFPIC